MPNTAVAAARALFWLEEGDLGDGGKEEALRRTATAEASRHIMISYCWGPVQSTAPVTRLAHG